MSDVSALRSSVPRPSLRDVAGAPFRLRTYGNLLYLALAFPTGLAYFLFVSIGLSLGVGLSVIGVGIPLFLATLLGVVALVTVERHLTVRLLGIDIPAPDWTVTDREGALDRVKGLVLDPAVWLGVVFLASKLLVGVAAFTLLLTLLISSFVLVATPLYYDTPGARVGVFLGDGVTRELSLYVPWNELVVGIEFVVELSSWEVSTLPGALAASAVGVIVLVLSLNVLNGVAWLSGQWARLLIGAPPLRTPDWR